MNIKDIPDDLRPSYDKNYDDDFRIFCEGRELGVKKSNNKPPLIGPSQKFLTYQEGGNDKEGMIFFNNPQKKNSSKRVAEVYFTINGYNLEVTSIKLMGNMRDTSPLIRNILNIGEGKGVKEISFGYYEDNSTRSLKRKDLINILTSIERQWTNPIIGYGTYNHFNKISVTINPNVALLSLDEKSFALSSIKYTIFENILHVYNIRFKTNNREEYYDKLIDGIIELGKKEKQDTIAFYSLYNKKTIQGDIHRPLLPSIEKKVAQGVLEIIPNNSSSTRKSLYRLVTLSK